MSVHYAPLYVRAFDTALWLQVHTGDLRALGQRDLAAEIDRLARDLTTEIGLALTFPVQRAEHQRRADEALLALRLRLRWSHALHALTAAQLRYVSGELDPLGRMLGGWRRSWRIESARRTHEEAKAGAAPTA